MKNFVKISAFSVATLLAASSASAVTISAMDTLLGNGQLNTNSDEVMFTVDTGGDTIEKLTFTIQQSGNDNRSNGGRFSLTPENVGATLLTAGVDATVSVMDEVTARGQVGFSTVMLSFADGFSGELSFTTWLNGLAIGDDRGGLIRDERSANSIVASAIFAGGIGSTLSIFTSTGDTGKFVTQTEISAVPLPASSLLLLAGIGGLAAMRRRKTA